MIITLVLLLINVYYTLAENILSVAFLYKDSIPFIDLFFINENSHFIVSVNTYLNFTHVKESDFKFTIPSQIIEQTKVSLFRDYYGYSYCNDIQIKDKIINKFYYLITNQDLVFNEDIGLSLSYKYKDEAYSLIHHLYHSKVINHLQFAFEIKQTGIDGFIYFGGIPNNTQLTLPYKGICQVNDNNSSSWGCPVHTITFNNNVYNINKYVLLHTGVNGYFLSDEVYKVFVNILKEDIEKNDCMEKKNSNNIKWIVCSNMIGPKTHKENITFEIGNFKMNISINQLFECSFDQCESKVYSKHYALDRTNNTYIGIDFINLFNYSVFDYERKQVVFYTDQFIIEQSILLEQTKRGIIIQWICSSIIVLLILFIILLLFTYKKIE